MNGELWFLAEIRKCRVQLLYNFCLRISGPFTTKDWTTQAIPVQQFQIRNPRKVMAPFNTQRSIELHSSIEESMDVNASKTTDQYRSVALRSDVSSWKFEISSSLRF